MIYRKISGAAILGVVLVLCAQVARPAHACSCLITAGFETFPEDGATDVPRDTFLWVTPDVEREDPSLTEALMSEDLTLVPEDGEPIFIKEAPLNDSTWLVLSLFKPEEALLADTEYQVKIGNATISRFTTGSDLAPEPTTPEVEVGPGRADITLLPGLGILEDSCGSSYGVGISADSGAAYYMIDLGDELTVEDPTFEDIRDRAYRVSEGSFTVGRHACGGLASGTYWSGETVRVAAINHAGEFSEWSEPVTVRYPLPGCSCVASPWRKEAIYRLLVPLMLFFAFSRRTARRR